MISNFSGQYDFLSNFYESPFTDKEGLEYKTNEHFFQAQKMVNYADKLEVINASNPQLAKFIGRGRPMYKNWEEMKPFIMLYGLRKKFAIPELREKLLATGDEVLVEGNTWHDNEWGCCTCAQCKEKVKLNTLGKLLMRVREEIKNGEGAETDGI